MPNRGEIRRKELTRLDDLNIRVVPRHACVLEKPAISVEGGGRVLSAAIWFVACRELTPESVQSVPRCIAVERSQPLLDRKIRASQVQRVLAFAQESIDFVVEDIHKVAFSDLIDARFVTEVEIELVRMHLDFDAHAVIGQSLKRAGFPVGTDSGERRLRMR